MAAMVLAKRAQAAALKSMNAPLKKVYGEISKEITALGEQNIMVRYRVGTMVAEVTNNERHYGEQAVPTLSTALGGQVSPTQLWEFRTLANAFNPGQIKKIVARTTSGGKNITFNHLRLLSNLRPNTRGTMVKKVFVEDLTTDELAAAIQSATGGKKSKGGRKPQLPKTIVAGLSQIGKLSGDVHKRMGIWNKAVFTKCEKGPADDIDADTLKAIRAAQKDVQVLISDSQHLLSSLEKSEARSQRVIDGRKKKAVSTKSTASPASTKKAATKGASADKIANAKKKKKRRRAVTV